MSMTSSSVLRMLIDRLSIVLCSATLSVVIMGGLTAVSGAPVADAATYAEQMDLDALASASHRVILGDVTGLSVSRNGSDLQTQVTVRVQETWMGAPSTEVQFIVPGGALQDQLLVIPGAPQFVEGQQVLLFLDAEDRVVGFGQGAFLVTRGMAWRGLKNAVSDEAEQLDPAFPLSEVRRAVR